MAVRAAKSLESRMKNLKEKVQMDKVPQHVAIIMDGNGRWATQKGLPRVIGHRNGVKAVRAVTEGAGELGITHLTLYAFSTENWKRPAFEVQALMTLLVETVKAEIKTFNENNIRLKAIGDLEKLPRKSREALRDGISQTASNTGLTLILALNYSARWDILQATQSIAKAAKSKQINPEDIDEQVFESHLSTKDYPDPELMIRTSGESRISNFLLWQLAYAELYFTPIFWPEFRKEHFFAAILDFQKRERRFGKTSDQLST